MRYRRVTSSVIATKFALLLALAALTSFQYAKADEVYGVWREPETGADIETFACPQDEALLCGRIVRVPDSAAGTDAKNPDPALRDRALLRLQILEAFEPVAPGRWEGGGQYGKLPGRIYLPANGDTLGDHRNRYKLVLDGDTLIISIANCGVLNCLGKSVWRRVSGEQ